MKPLASILVGLLVRSSGPWMKWSVPSLELMISSFSEVQAQMALLLLNIIVLECSAPQDKEGCAEAKLLGKLCTTAPIPGQVRRQKSFRAFGLVYLDCLNYAVYCFSPAPIRNGVE